MKLKQLLDKHDDKTILTKIVEIYPDQKRNIKGYQKTLNQLRKLKPRESDFVIHPNKYGTYGTSESKKIESDSWALDFTRFEEWLGMTMAKGGIDSLCKCLWEMTYHGFTQQPIQRKINSIYDQINELETINRG